MLHVESLPYRTSGRTYVAVLELTGTDADGDCSAGYARNVHFAGDAVDGKLVLHRAQYAA